MPAVVLRRSNLKCKDTNRLHTAQVETFGTPANDMIAQRTPITPAPAINPEAVVSLNRWQCSGLRNSQILAAIAPLSMTHDCSGKMMNARPILVPLGTYLPTNRLTLTCDKIHHRHSWGRRTRSRKPSDCCGVNRMHSMATRRPALP
jgi:hypothetical protein